MTLFFDRDVGTAVPKALEILRIQVEYHQKYFPQNSPDDVWMPAVGQWGWTIIGHDSQHHAMPNELSAIKQYNLGCFYLWGAEASRWEKMRCLARAYDRIVTADVTTGRPFIYRVTRTGRLTSVPIP